MKRFLRALTGILVAALPASAQVLVLPTPRLATPLAPVMFSLPLAHPMGDRTMDSLLVRSVALQGLGASEGAWGVRGPLLTAAPTLSLPSLSAPKLSVLPSLPTSPEPRVEARPSAALARAQAGYAMDATLDSLVVREGASEEFYLRVRSLIARLPRAVLLAAIALDYRVQVKEYVTQGRPDLPEVDDKGGGLHDWGEKGDHIIIAEKVLVDLKDADGVFRGRSEWQDSLYWENAVLHELGHVMDRAFGISGEDDLLAALAADYADIPAELKGSKLPDGSVNKFYYFLQPDGDRVSRLSRREICAEAFDVLLRGERSTYNYANFAAHLPRTLAVLRAKLEAKLGPLALVESVGTLEYGPFRALIGPLAADGDARVEIVYRGVRYADPMALSAAAIANGEQRLLREFFAKLDEAVERYRAANRG